MQGQLFSQDFLTRGVTETPLHQALTDAAFAVFRNSLNNIFKGLDGASTINEAQTEQVVINKVLAELGWADDYLPQVNSDAKGREAVPDCLLFAGSDNDPGHYFLFDRDKKSLAEVIAARPQLAGRTLATVKQIGRASCRERVLVAV